MKIGKGAIQRRHSIERKIVGFIFLVSISLFLFIFLVPFFGSMLFLTGIKNNLDKMNINSLDFRSEDGIDVDITYSIEFPLFSMEVRNLKVGLSTSRNEHPVGYLYSERVEILNGPESNIVCSMKYAAHKEKEEIPEEYLLKVENHIVITLQGTFHFKINKYLSGISIPVSFPYALGLFIGNVPPRDEKLIDRFTELKRKEVKTVRSRMPIYIEEYKIEEQENLLTVSGRYQYRVNLNTISMYIPPVEISIYMNGVSVGRISLGEQDIGRDSSKKHTKFTTTHTEPNIIHLRKCLELYFSGSVVEVTFSVTPVEETIAMPFIFHYNIIKKICDIYVHRLLQRKTKTVGQIKKDPLFELRIEDVTPIGLTCSLLFNEEIFPYKDLVNSLNSSILPSADLHLLLNDEITFCSSSFHSPPITKKDKYEYLVFTSNVFFPSSFTSTDKILSRKEKTEPIVKKAEIVIGNCEGKILSILFDSFGLRWQSGRGISVGFKWKDPNNPPPTVPPHNGKYSIDVMLSKETKSPYSVAYSTTGQPILSTSEYSTETVSESVEPVPFLTGKLVVPRKETGLEENIIRVRWPELNIVFMYKNEPITVNVNRSYIDVLVSESTCLWSIRGEMPTLISMYTNNYPGVIREERMSLVSIFRNRDTHGSYSPEAIKIGSSLYPNDPNKAVQEEEKGGVQDRLLEGLLNNISLGIRTESVGEIDGKVRVITGSVKIDAIEIFTGETGGISKDYNKTFSVNLFLPKTCLILKPVDSDCVSAMISLEKCKFTLVKGQKKSMLIRVHSPDGVDRGSDFKIYLASQMVSEWANLEAVGVNGTFFPWNREIRGIYAMSAAKIKDENKTVDTENEGIKEKDGTGNNLWKKEDMKVARENKMDFSVHVSEDREGTVSVRSAVLVGGSDLIYEDRRKDGEEGILSSPGVYLRIDRENENILQFDTNIDVVYLKEEPFTFHVQSLLRIKRVLFDAVDICSDEAYIGVLESKEEKVKEYLGKKMSLSFGYIECTGRRAKLFDRIDFDLKKFYKIIINRVIKSAEDRRNRETPKSDSAEENESPLKVLLGNMQCLVVTKGTLLFDAETQDTTRTLIDTIKKELSPSSALIESMYKILRMTEPKYNTYISPHFREIENYIKTRDNSKKDKKTSYRELKNVHFPEDMNFVNYNIPVSLQNGFLDRIELERSIKKFKKHIGNVRREISVEVVVENLYVMSFCPNTDTSYNPVSLVVNRLRYSDFAGIQPVENTKKGILSLNMSVIAPHIILLPETAISPHNVRYSSFLSVASNIYKEKDKVVESENFFSRWAIKMKNLKSDFIKISTPTPTKKNISDNYYEPYVTEKKIEKTQSYLEIEEPAEGIRGVLNSLYNKIADTVKGASNYFWSMFSTRRSISDAFNIKYMQISENNKLPGHMKSSYAAQENIHRGILYYGLNSISIERKKEFNEKSSPYVLIAYKDSPLGYVSLNLNNKTADMPLFFPTVACSNEIFNIILDIFTHKDHPVDDESAMINLYMYLVVNNKIALSFIINTKVLSHISLINHVAEKDRVVSKVASGGEWYALSLAAWLFRTVGRKEIAEEIDLTENKIDINTLYKEYKFMNNLVLSNGNHIPRIYLL